MRLTSALFSNVRQCDKTKVLNAVPTVAVQPVNPSNIFTIGNLLFLPVLSHIARPIDNFLSVLVGNLKSIDSVLTRPNGECLGSFLLIYVESDRAVLLPSGLEDGGLASIGEGGPDASHEIVLGVVPNLDLSQFNHLFFEHLLHFRLSGPLEIYLAVLVHARQDGQFAPHRACNGQGVVEEYFLKLFRLCLQEHVDLIFETVLILHSPL